MVVLNRQSLFDLAIQIFGDVRAAFDLAEANGLSITDEVAAGQKLVVPESLYKEEDIQRYYKSKGILPATAITSEEIDINPNGDCCLCDN